MPSVAAGAFQRRVTPPFPLLIATKPTGASCAARAVPSLSLFVGEGSTLSEAFGFGAAESSLSLFDSAKIARTTIPAITKKRTVGELDFLTGADGVVPFAGAGVVEIEVVGRFGTGGITILVASTFDAELFLTLRFVAAFLTVRLTLFLLARAVDFFAAGFFTLFLTGRFAGAFFLAATNLSSN